MLARLLNNRKNCLQIEQKRKKQRKEGRADEPIPEDEADKFKHAVYVMTMKVYQEKLLENKISIQLQSPIKSNK